MGGLLYSDLAQQAPPLHFTLLFGKDREEVGEGVGEALRRREKKKPQGENGSEWRERVISLDLAECSSAAALPTMVALLLLPNQSV